MDENKTLTTGVQAIPIDEAHFPDENFRSYVAKHCSNDGRVLTPEDIAKVTEIDCSCRDIFNLTGIKYFTALERLNCSGTNLISLNVSNNTALEELYCSVNQLTTLDISGCTALERLHCSVNNLTTLDISKNPALKELGCSHNDLKTLDINNNLLLKHLDCVYNNLETLDVSNNARLEYLDHNDNAPRFTLIKESQEKSFADMSGDRECTKKP